MPTTKARPMNPKARPIMSHSVARAKGGTRRPPSGVTLRNESIVEDIRRPAAAPPPTPLPPRPAGIERQRDPKGEHGKHRDQRQEQDAAAGRTQDGVGPGLLDNLLD